MRGSNRGIGRLQRSRQNYDLLITYHDDIVTRKRNNRDFDRVIFNMKWSLYYIKKHWPCRRSSSAPEQHTQIQLCYNSDERICAHDSLVNMLIQVKVSMAAGVKCHQWSPLWQYRCYFHTLKILVCSLKTFFSLKGEYFGGDDDSLCLKHNTMLLT